MGALGRQRPQLPQLKRCALPLLLNYLFQAAAFTASARSLFLTLFQFRLVSVSLRIDPLMGAYLHGWFQAFASSNLSLTETLHRNRGRHR